MSLIQIWDKFKMPIVLMRSIKLNYFKKSKYSSIHKKTDCLHIHNGFLALLDTPRTCTVRCHALLLGVQYVRLVLSITGLLYSIRINYGVTVSGRCKHRYQQKEKDWTATISWKTVASGARKVHPGYDFPFSIQQSHLSAESWIFC